MKQKRTIDRASRKGCIARIDRKEQRLSKRAISLLSELATLEA